MKRIVVLPDIQSPYHDPRAVAVVQQFVRDYQPDELLCVGDEVDAPEPARWSKGCAMEYAPTLQRGLDVTHRIMATFRDALGDKPFRVQRSNHADRLETYVKRYAPAFASLRVLTIEALLGYPELEIEYRRRIMPVAPGWLMAHGDEGSLSRYAGGTAINLAKKLGASVVCGHTHRAGVIAHTTGLATSTRTITGLEVGHLMDMRQASYLKTGAADWQQALGVLYVHNDKVTPVLVPIHRGGRFVVEGQEYGP